MDSKIVSPCLSVCRTDPISEYCYGCGRTNAEKYAKVARATKRLYAKSKQCNSENGRDVNLRYQDNRKDRNQGIYFKQPVRLPLKERTLKRL